MPSYIVKASPNEDFYIRWSTIVDGPTDWGTRAELTQLLLTSEAGGDRFTRADERGTSADWPDWPVEKLPYHWSDVDFLVYASTPDNGPWMLPRENLRAYCEAGPGTEAAWKLLRKAASDD